MRKLIFILFTAILIAAPSPAQEKKSLPLEKVPVTDTLKLVESYSKINDYSLLGVSYGAAISSVSFDPVRNAESVIVPINVGITYTRYGKLFGYMPYFGFQVGLNYSKDAYQFKKNPLTGYQDNILYASKATIETIELPFMAHLHYDFWKMRIMADVGVYGGYRLTVHREYNENVSESRKKYENSFHPNENRWDYGIKAGAGIAFIFDPVELHIMGFYKYSWSNLHQPDVDARTMEHTESSKYYYKWSYPTNIILSVGIHYQLTRRIGKTRAEMKREAREEAIRIIEDEKNNGEDR